MSLTVTQRFAKQLMLLRPNEVHYTTHAGAEFREVFDHPEFLALDQTSRLRLGLDWARSLYDQECERPLFREHFPDFDLESLLRDKAILDVGCYVGGKTVRWAKSYRTRSAHGIDIDERFIQVANAFAAQMGANAKFSIGFAERLEFPDDTFDAILTENTLEHVSDVGAAMSEFRRVLRPGGVLVAIFPSFWGPTSHHLDLVTRSPFVHWLVGFKNLLAAYNSILDDRGQQAAWYRREERKPKGFERGYSINGMGAARFRQIIEAGNWSVLADGFANVHFNERGLGKRLTNLLKWSRLPISRELLPISYVLQKSTASNPATRADPS